MIGRSEVVFFSTQKIHRGFFSYYIMDGSNKRVTFDEDEGQNQEMLPPIATDETINGNEVDDQDDVDEVEETVSLFQ